MKRRRQGREAFAAGDKRFGAIDAANVAEIDEPVLRSRDYRANQESAMRAFTAVALMAATILPPVQASAQQPAERDACFAQNGVSPDLRLSACTAVIESGKEAPRMLAEALMRRGNAYFNDKQDYDRAIQDYDAIIRIDPNKALAFNNRGNGYLRKAQYDRALQDFDQALRLDPKFALALVNRAAVHRAKARFDDAIRDCDQAIAINAKFAAAYFGRAASYQEKAAWEFDAYLSQEQYTDRAIADFDEAIRLDPNNAAALQRRANIHVDKRQYDRAIADYTEAIRLKPKDGWLFKNRAYAFRFAGQYDRAIADYRIALTLIVDEPGKNQVKASLKQLGVAS
jgi:tetratricopeptide (TPR) repeat protein